MQKEPVSPEEVIELAKKMAPEKLKRWYELGLFIESNPSATPASQTPSEDYSQLMQEFTAWEAASDEDWQKLESGLAEVS
jgi:hypothetical protein